MQLKQIVSGISGIIPDGISVKDFSMITKLDPEESEIVLEVLLAQEIGKKQNDIYYFSRGDKLKTALLALSRGADVDLISEILDWKDFEGLTAEILESKNFATIKNLILTKPRMEIDVVGIRLGVALLIDCKHWKRQSFSTLSDAVHKQIERTKLYVSKTEGAVALPVIVTLHNEQIDFIEKVPVVPISQLSSFVDEFYGNMDNMSTIETNQ